MKKTILLTGSEGYIGKNFKNIFQDKYLFIELDKKINKPVELYTFDNHFDCIVHLAAISGIQNCENNKEQATIDNITCTMILMAEAYKRKIPMIFASSQAAKNPESSFYATTKYIGETTAKMFNNFGAMIYVLRFANVYGGIDYLKDKTSVVAKFLNNHKNNETMIVNGNGFQTRDFIYVKGVCNAIDKAINCNDIINKPLDVGTGCPVEILEIAQMISNKYIIDLTLDGGAGSSIANVAETIKYLNFDGSGFVDMLEYYINLKK